MALFFRRLRYLLNRRRSDRELAGDMEFHREMAARGGGAPFGNMLRLREEARDAWGWTWIDRLVQDLRYAARTLRKSPGFTLSAILMLAIGVGVNVAVFGFFDLIVLRPLQVRDPATLLRFHRRAPDQYAFVLPYPEAAFFSENSRTLSAVLASNITKLSIEGEAKPLSAHFVTANFFTELGATAALGRALDPARDGRPESAPAVVLSDGFWKRHFGKDRGVVGRTIHLNGKPALVVGVAAPEFSGLSLEAPDLWAPITRQPYFAEGSQLLTDFSEDGSGVDMWGRLQKGLAPEVAEGELRSLAAELRKRHPGSIWEKETLPSESGGYAKSLMIGGRRGTGTDRDNDFIPVMALMSGLSLLILAIACGNLSSLLLARGVAREREIGIRVAVGAGRTRLIRQLFTESLLLAMLGAASGLAMGYVVLRSVMTLTNIPAWLNPAPDWRISVFAIGIGFVSAILFGLTPALQLARQRHRATFIRQILVGAQVAGSCILLIVAGLLIRALNHVTSAPPGFEYQRVISIEPNLEGHGYSPARAAAYFDALASRIRAVPGVASVSLTLSPPLGNRREGAGIELNGRAVAIQINRVDPDFLPTMRIPLLQGRNLQKGEMHGIVISQSLAHEWPTPHPVGGNLSIGSDFTVVGVSGTARLTALEDSSSVEVYLLSAPTDLPSEVMLVRTAGRPEDLTRSAADISKALDPAVFPEIRMLKNSFREKLQGAKVSALVASILGFVAHLLACLGIVGVVAYAVSQRTKEIGLRMALGANASQVMSTVLRQFSIPVALGSLVGVAGALAISQVLRRVLYGVSNLDPAAYAAAIGVFLITVAVAAVLPARRALSIDPMRALRQD